MYRYKHYGTHFVFVDGIISKVSLCFFLFNQHPLMEKKKKRQKALAID
jgi:hypothetical protein